MKTLPLILGLILLTACNSAPKDGTETSPPEQHLSKEKKTSYGKAVQRARDLDEISQGRNEEMKEQLDDAE